ncbi:MAG: hypothetical protein RSD14_00300 [Clostridia bacterium]
MLEIKDNKNKGIKATEENNNNNILDKSVKENVEDLQKKSVESVQLNKDTNLKNKSTINEVSNKNKQKIVPAYVKKDNEEKDSNNKDNINGVSIKKKKDKKAKKIMIIIPVVIIFAIVMIFGIYKVLTYFGYKAYIPFEKEIIMYGFDKAYDNSTANTGESITKSEALKMAIATALNTNDITGVAKELEKEEYKNQMWVEYGQYIGVIAKEEINKNNYKEEATYSDVLRYFTNAKTKILDKKLDTDIVPNVKDYTSLKPDEQIAVADMVYNKIVSINAKNMKLDKKVIKGQVNEIIKNYVEKYNTIAPQGEKLNISADKMPSNVADYPYTLASIDKKVYEMDRFIKNSKDMKTPKQVYAGDKQVYDQIKYNVENYYNKLLNIDYETIEANSFSESLTDYLLLGSNIQEVQKYVDYVKQNKIKLAGTATTQMPIVYYDGIYYRARVKLEFEIKYSNTDKNLIYNDLTYSIAPKNADVVYDKDKYLIYADVILSKSGTSSSLYLMESSVYECVFSKLDLGIKIQERE